MGGRLRVAGLVWVAVVAVASLAGLAGEPAATATAPIDDKGDVFLASRATTSCVESYSARSLAKRAFAFDGTVTGIDSATDTSFATVTFRVHRWYTNGSRDHVVVAMLQPDGTSYRVGSRMLVSGEAAADRRSHVAWACGFTRWYDEREAAVWRRTFGFPFAARI